MSDHPYSRPGSPSGSSGGGTGRNDPAGDGTSHGRRRQKLGYRSLLAWLAIFWERVWPSFWPAASLAGLFVALALFDILPDLSGWLHVSILAVLGVAFVAAVVYGVRGLRAPRRDDVQRRIETASGLEHRPLTVVDDKMAVGSGDPYAEAVWRAHQARARLALKSLKVGAPKPPVARRDPFAVRGAVLVMLALGLATGWSDADTRLARAFMPSFAPVEAQKVTVEAWLTPPEYTGLTPRMVTLENGSKPIEVPDGTRIMIQVHGGRGEPTMSFGKQRIAFKKLDETSYEGQLLLINDGQVRRGDRLTVRQRGRAIVSWPVRLIADKKPKIAWAKDPSNARLSLRVDYKASDDYRIAKIRAYVARHGETEFIELGLPVTGSKNAKGTSYHDLTAHRWAGLKVSVMLEVEDDRGNTGLSKIKDVVLPERRFQNAVAREIIRQRKLLTISPEKTYWVVRGLGRVADRPKLFGEDKVVYLALRLAQTRLIMATRVDGRNDTDMRTDRDKAIRNVQRLLWSTALRIEEGGISEAERELRRLQRKLMEKLSQNKTNDKEIQKLLEQLRQAMQKYMKALREDMKRNPDKYRNDPNRAERLMTPEDMKRMFNQLKDMAQLGQKEQLKRMLSQLQKMMENMRANRGRPMDPNHPALRSLRELGDIIRRQQQLMDETHKRSEQRRSGKKTDPKADQRAQKEQQQLRKRLGELMKKLGEMTGKIPQNLGNAEREMRRAERQLRGNRPGRATGPQGRAIEQLRRGARQAMRQLGQRFGFGPGRGLGNYTGRPGQRFRGSNRDPLGRDMEGMGPLNTDDVKVPTDAERKRARDILEELRRRSGDPSRPKLERQYIERLLRQF